MTDKNSISNYLKILINGILMGTANKIPGVSGGLVAIAIGFYEELIFSLKRFDKTALKFLIKFLDKEDVAKSNIPDKKLSMDKQTRVCCEPKLGRSR